MSVPRLRIRRINDAAPAERGRYVLYWMTAFRRTTWNFALERAVEHARKLDKPLVVFEPLRCGYPWASDRLHRFVLQGMADNAARLAGGPVRYVPWVETEPGGGKGLLEHLAKHAAVVVTDDYPAFFLPRMLTAAGNRLTVALEAIDSNGLFPLRAADRVFPTAHSFRRFLQKNLREHLDAFPKADPLSRVRLPEAAGLPRLTGPWRPASPQLLDADPAAVAALPIDHGVGVGAQDGGARAAARALRRFLRNALETYDERRNHPDYDATSGLSPYLHFGHLSSHQVFRELASVEEWSPLALSDRTDGSRSGWWGAGASAEAFLDQLVTWRELGFNKCALEPGYDRFESLPSWAQETLAEHEDDPRPHVYDLGQFEAAATHDRLWNAAQTQLVREGRLHNYLRMLWGKKILEWSRTPREALAIMIELNNKYALDGRDPNSYSGIMWTLGRYDRAWGPERQIFGKVRYMSAENTARKLRLRAYLERYGSRPVLFDRD